MGQVWDERIVAVVDGRIEEVLRPQRACSGGGCVAASWRGGVMLFRQGHLLFGRSHWALHVMAVTVSKVELALQPTVYIPDLPNGLRTPVRALRPA